MLNTSVSKGNHLIENCKELTTSNAAVATVTGASTTTDLVNSNWVAKTSTWQPAAHVTDAEPETTEEVSWDEEIPDVATLDVADPLKGADIWDVVPRDVVSVDRLVTVDGGKVDIMVVKEPEIDVVNVVVAPGSVWVIVLIKLWVSVLEGAVCVDTTDEVTEFVIVLRLVIVEAGKVDVRVVREPEIVVVWVTVEPGSVWSIVLSKVCVAVIDEIRVLVIVVRVVMVDGGKVDVKVVREPEIEVVCVIVEPGSVWIVVLTTVWVIVLSKVCVAVVDEIKELVIVVRVVTVDGGKIDVRVVREPDIDVVCVMVEPGSVWVIVLSKVCVAVVDEIKELVMVVRVVIVDGGTIDVRVVREPDIEVVCVTVEPGSIWVAVLTTVWVEVCVCVVVNDEIDKLVTVERLVTIDGGRVNIMVVREPDIEVVWVVVVPGSVRVKVLREVWTLVVVKIMIVLDTTVVGTSEMTVVGTSTVTVEAGSVVREVSTETTVEGVNVVVVPETDIIVILCQVSK
jgi:hypothetical protein